MSTSASPEQPHDLGLLTLSLWFGILGGLGEVAVHAIRRFVRHRFVFVSDDAIWMAPLAVVLLLLVIGAGLVLLQRLRRRPTNPVLIPCFLFVSLAGILLSYTRLHWWASVIIALGLAVQLTRWERRRPARVARFISRSLPALMGLVLLLALGLVLARRLTREPSGPVPPPGTPNIMLVIFDTVRELDFDGGDGFQRNFPRLYQRSLTGLRFTRAFAPSPWTLPSHATMFTGRWPHEHQANWDEPLSRTYPSLAEALAQAGYATGGFVANKIYATRASGLSRGFQVYHDFLVSPGEMIHSSTVLRMITDNRKVRRLLGSYQAVARKNADQVNRETLDWIAGHGDRPFFAFLNYFDAHSPYIPKPPFDSALVALVGAHGNRMRWFDADYSEHLPTPAVLRESEAAYAGMLHFLDDRFDALLDSLELRGVLRNTWVILTADHGEEFGEHGLLGHGHNLYRTSVQVPLVIWGPGVAPGVSDRPVSLRNVAATAMQWAAPGRPHPFPGTSLVQLMATGDSARSEMIYVAGMEEQYNGGGGDVFSWADDSVRVIRYYTGREDTLPFSDPLERK